MQSESMVTDRHEVAKAALDSPVLFLVFNRPETTKRVFESIRQARPRQLFLAADGPRTNVQGEAEKCAAVREIVSQVDWDCEVQTLFRDRNLGCKGAVSSAIDWFFEYVEAGIILEDDCLPSDTFYGFCSELLSRYADDERVMMISGDNFQDGHLRGSASYFFSRIPHIWGWATWRQAWSLYSLDMELLPKFLESGGLESISCDVDVQNFWLSSFINVYQGRINTWDYQWMFAMFAAGGVSICPQYNLVSNLGFGKASTHTKEDGNRYACMERMEIGNIDHPEAIEIDEEADAYTYRVMCDVGFHSKGSGLARWRKLSRRRWKARALRKAFEAGTILMEEK